MIVLIRTLAEIRRAFIFNPLHAAALRGTADEIASAEWLFNELDQRTDMHAASATWRLRDADDEIMRVFYVPLSASAEDLNRLAAAVRSRTKIRRLFTYARARAIAVRGSLAQVGAAEQLIRE